MGYLYRKPEIRLVKIKYERGANGATEPRRGEISRGLIAGTHTTNMRYNALRAASVAPSGESWCVSAFEVGDAVAQFN